MLGLRERIQRKSHQLRVHPQIGEVVLVKDNLPRGRWKVGKIVELGLGKDKKIRSAKVLMAPHRHLHRPLKLLYPLECTDSNFQPSDNHGDHVVPAAKEADSREQESETVTPVPNEVDHQELEKGDKVDVYGDSLIH